MSQLSLDISGPSPQPDPELQTKLDVIVNDTVHDQDRQIVLDAIMQDANGHDWNIDPNRVRAALTNRYGLIVTPQVIGAVYNQLRARKIIEATGWVLSTDKAGGNSGKPVRQYALTSKAVTP